MSINHTKIPADLNCDQLIDINEIVREVNQYGFCAAKLSSIAPQALNAAAAIDVANAMAKQAQLQLSINFALNLCVFERFIRTNL